MRFLSAEGRQSAGDQGDFARAKTSSRQPDGRMAIGGRQWDQLPLSVPGTGGACPVPPTPAFACLIDDTLGNAIAVASAKAGYFYTYTPTAAPAGSYTNLATPANQNSTGVKNFFTDESGVVRFVSGAAATAASPAI